MFTSSLSRVYRYIDDLRVGTVLVNESTNFWEQHPPFGGAGGTRTGWGRYDNYSGYLTVLFSCFHIFRYN